MATGSKRYRLTVEVTFTCEQDKGAFQAKLDAAKRLLFRDSPLHHRDTYTFLTAMLDHVLDSPVHAPGTSSTTTASGTSLLDNCGTCELIKKALHDV